MKFFIYPRLDGRVYELLVEYYPPPPLSNIETFKIKGKSVMIIESNRMFFRRKNINKRRPEYILKKGNHEAQLYFKGVVKAVDEWVIKNLDC